MAILLRHEDVAGLLSTDDVWDQPGVTAASSYVIPYEEMDRWARERELWALRIELVVHAGGDILQSKLEEVVGVSRQPARTRLNIDS